MLIHCYTNKKQTFCTLIFPLYYSFTAGKSNRWSSNTFSTSSCFLRSLIRSHFVTAQKKKKISHAIWLSFFFLLLYNPMGNAWFSISKEEQYSTSYTSNPIWIRGFLLIKINRQLHLRGCNSHPFTSVWALTSKTTKVILKKYWSQC